MTQKEMVKELEALVKSIQRNENECIREMGFLNKHGFALEREAVRYKQLAYNDCWLALLNVIDKIRV